MTTKFRSLVAVLICLCACQVAKAADLYVYGSHAFSTTIIFGKVDTTTGVFQMINSNIAPYGAGGGIAWNPNINKFNTVLPSGAFNTIDTNGTVGTPIATGLQAGQLGYDSTNSIMYNITSTLYTVNTTTGVQTSVGQTGYTTIYSVATAGGTVYGTAYINSGGPKWYYGSFNTATGAFTPISASDGLYGSMRLAYDGTTMYGLRDDALYTINTATGAYTLSKAVSGLGFPLSPSAAAFGPVTVPEPSTYALAAIATGVMAAVARRRKAMRA